MSWHRFISAVRYACKARGAKWLHSPYVFELQQTVLNASRQHYAFEWLRALRAEMEKDGTTLHIQDYGAGSTSGAGKERTVATIAKHSVKREKHAELMFRLINHLQPKAVLELGTSLGLTSLYLHQACPTARLVTLEGAPELCRFANGLFEGLNAHIEVVEGPFDQTLETTASSDSWDVVFIDGNHRRDATLQAVETLWPHLSENAVLIIDDIYWSKGMTEAWKELHQREVFSLSIDVFEMGLLFKGRPMAKQHFVLRY